MFRGTCLELFHLNETKVCFISIFFLYLICHVFAFLQMMLEVCVEDDENANSNILAGRSESLEVSRKVSIQS